MSLKLNTGTPREPIAEGVHVAVCYAIYDLGTQYNEKFKKFANKILVTWEVPDSRIEIERDGETLDLPKAISKQYTTVISDRSNLSKDLRALGFSKDEVNGDFDITSLLGTACQMQVVHSSKNGRVFGNVGVLMPLPPGTEAPKAENPLKTFDITDVDVDSPKLPDDMPDWVKEIIRQSCEWQEITKHSPETRENKEEPKDPTTNKLKGSFS